MGAANEAAYVTAPIAGDIIRIPVNDSVDRYAIPAAFAGAPCNWVLYGTDADIVFGGAAVTCVYDQESTVVSETITPHTSTGPRLKDGVKQYWVMPSAANAGFFAIDALGSGTGKLEITVAGAR